MKKLLAILMSLALILSCLVGAALTSSAALEYVNETYSYADATIDFGTHGEGVDPDERGAVIAEEFIFGENWTYEYWDPADETFKPMTAWYQDNWKDEGWVHWTWSRFYTAVASSAWEENEYTYCSITSSGKSIYPSTGAAPAVTFIVPATGVISYEASLYCNSENNNPQKMGEDKYGNLITLWVNDVKIWPETEEESIASGLSNGSPDSAFKIDVTSFNVKEGDRVRLCIAARGGNRSNKGTVLVDMPVVTYHSAEVPIGNPKGEAPSNITTGKYTSEGFTVSWNTADNAAGYNVYINGDKHNTDPISDTFYVVTGLESNTIYNVTVTTVTNAGQESDPSQDLPVRTKKATSVATDTQTTKTDTADVSTNAPASTGSDAGNEKGSFPWWIIVVAAVVVVAVVVVLVLVLGKKKKPAEDAVAVESAPTESPAEEATPAEEEKKDEE